MSQKTKESIVLTCYQSVQNQITNLNNMVSDLALDALNDAKSSAGDKHEVGLAMMHLEQEKLNQKLSILLQQKQILGAITFTNSSKIIVVGSLIKTSNAYFLVSIALPKFIFDNISVFSISPEAPLTKEFLGKKAQDIAVFNGVTYLIEEIL